MAYETDFSKAFESYDHTTIREDLSDFITIMSPADAPLLQNLPQVGTHARTFDWMVDDITKPTARVAVREGADVVASGDINLTRSRSRLVSTLQINRAFIDVTDSDRAFLKGGIDDEFTYQIWKSLLTVLKQVEFQLHHGKPDAGGAGTGSNNPRQTPGFLWWLIRMGLSTNAATTFCYTAGSPAEVNFATYDLSGSGEHVVYKPAFYNPATATNLTRTLFENQILRPAHVKGMTIDGSIWHMSSLMKSLFSDFGIAITEGGAVERNTRNINASENYLDLPVHAYNSIYGEIYLNIDRYMEDDTTLPYYYNTGSEVLLTLNFSKTIFGYQPGFMELAVLRPAQFTMLAKIGDSSKGMIVMEYGTKVLNPLVLAGGTNLHL